LLGGQQRRPDGLRELRLGEDVVLLLRRAAFVEALPVAPRAAATAPALGTTVVVGSVVELQLSAPSGRRAIRATGPTGEAAGAARRREAPRNEKVTRLDRAT